MKRQGLIVVIMVLINLFMLFVSMPGARVEDQGEKSYVNELIKSAAFVGVEIAFNEILMDQTEELKKGGSLVITAEKYEKLSNNAKVRLVEIILGKGEK